MNAPRRPSGPAIASAALAGAASYLTLLSWNGLSDDATAYLVPLFWICAGVAAGGLLLRTVGLSPAVVFVLQLLGVGATLLHVGAPAAPLAGWLPTPAAIQGLTRALDHAVVISGQYAAPIPAQVAGFAPLMIVLGSGLALLVDLLAGTLGRPTLAGLPMLAAFTVPVTLVGGVPWVTFASAALCFVFLLTADQADRLGRWGPEKSGPAVRDSQPHEVRLGTLWPGATRVGAVGIGLAVLAPAVVPAGESLLGNGSGSGSGGGDGGVTLTNPFVDMKRDLVQGRDVPLVRVRTDDPDPAYLRLAVLDQFDGVAWRPGSRQIPEADQANGLLPAAPGLSATTERTQHRSTITLASSFGTQWLPTPYPASAISVRGDWRYDRDTLDVVSAQDGQDGAGLSYRVDSLDVRPSTETLVSAAPPPDSVVSADTKLPDTMPPWLHQLALTVTNESKSDFERAVKLQDWFRRDGGFTYSLERRPGNGLEALELFLGTGPGSRIGYCEQFAAAMAMMARSLGIPARVAVGFLRPDRQPDGTWVYSSRDMHAWPELYFQGAGWIRFEPTPAARTAAAPGYTTGPLPAAPSTALPSTDASQDTANRVGAQKRTPTIPTTSSTGSSGSRWPQVALGVLAVVLIVAAPRGVRGLLRRRRFSSGDPAALAEGCWAELRATAVDLGHGWDDGATLRRRAADLVPALSAPPGHSATAAPDRNRAEDPVPALERLVLLVERSRYSRNGLAPDEQDRLVPLTRTVSGASLAAAGSARRHRAEWLPRSLWLGRRRLTTSTAEDALRPRRLEHLSV